jgi:hypothetical protein
MRVNIYAEELTPRVEIVQKNGHTGVRFYLYLPVSLPGGGEARGPFEHRPGDDDSAAVTFWGRKRVREVLQAALLEMDALDAMDNAAAAQQPEEPF